MSDQRPVTDDRVTAMLEARASSPVPEGLETAIRTAVRAEASRRRPWVRGRGRGRGTGRTLAFVGLLLAGGLAATWVVGSRAPDRTIAPLGAACEEMEPIADASDLGAGSLPPLGSPITPPQNGGFILMAGNDPFELSLVDPWTGETEPRPITRWQLRSLPVTGIVPSPDGSLVAVQFYLNGGCADVLILRTDGSAARRPFEARATDSVYGAAWDPDGSVLAVTHERRAEGADLSPVEASSVLLWDPATGEITDLGASCATCSVRSGPVWSPDRSRIAVTYVDGVCDRPPGPSDPPAPTVAPSFELPCDRPGVAVADRSGAWLTFDGSLRRVGAWVVDPIGWLDARTLILSDAFDSGMRLDVETGVAARADVPSGVLSPDRRRVAVLEYGDVGPGPRIDVVDVIDGGRVSIATVLPDVLGSLTWSPDSTSIEYVAASRDGEDRGIFVVPADGSAPATRVLDGGFGALGWLPGAPSADGAPTGASPATSG